MVTRQAGTSYFAPIASSSKHRVTYSSVSVVLSNARGGGGFCGSGRRGIPCRRNAAFTLVVVVARTAATSRTVLPSST
jgi:hypothetical protein